MINIYTENESFGTSKGSISRKLTTEAEIVLLFDVTKKWVLSACPSFYSLFGHKEEKFNTNYWQLFLEGLTLESYKTVVESIKEADTLLNGNQFQFPVQLKENKVSPLGFTLVILAYKRNEKKQTVEQLLLSLRPNNAIEKKEIANTVPFFSSQELGQEYAKIQSIIQLIDNKNITEIERGDLINEAKKAIQIINSSIFKMNHALSFNQTEGFIDKQPKKNTYNKIMLIDDDVLTNVLNKKIINSVVPDKPLHIFLNIDDSLQFLKEKDVLGDYIIFLDINFPDRNGWDFLNEYIHFDIKSKLVILSSSIDNRDRERAKSFEIVVDYITKPLTMEFIKDLFD